MGKRKKIATTNRSPVLRVTFSETEYELLQAWVKENGSGRSLSKWAYEVLMSALPRDLVAIRLEGKDLEEAYAPEPTPPVSEDVNELMKAPIAKDHACVWLRLIFMGHLGPKECYGTCSNPRTAGKPCHWGSATAPNCPYFEPRLYGQAGAGR